MPLGWYLLPFCAFVTKILFTFAFFHSGVFGIHNCGRTISNDSFSFFKFMASLAAAPTRWSAVGRNVLPPALESVLSSSPPVSSPSSSLALPPPKLLLLLLLLPLEDDRERLLLRPFRAVPTTPAVVASSPSSSALLLLLLFNSSSSSFSCDDEEEEEEEMSAETRIVVSSSRVVVASLPHFDDDDDAKLPINRTPIANTPFSSPSLMRNSLTIKTKSETHRRSLHARYCEDFLLLILLDDPVFASLLGTERPIPSSLTLSSSS